MLAEVDPATVKETRGGPRAGSGRKKGSTARVLTREPVQVFARRCRESAPEILEILLKIARDEKQIPGARVHACGMILDRGFGKTPELLEVSTDVNVNANFKFESVEQFRATIEAQGIPQEFWPPFVLDVVEDEVKLARTKVLELVATRLENESDDADE